MTWIDNEIKRRAQAAQGKQALAAKETTSETGKMSELWDLIESCNNELPAEIRLQPVANPAATAQPGAPRFIAWFEAPNGAGLGFTGDAIRYVWPARSRGASHNFWIRWTVDKGHVLIQRAKSPDTAPVTIERRFDPRRVGDIIKALVTGKRLKPRSLRKRRLWIF